jgi:hypothetical protein
MRKFYDLEKSKMEQEEKKKIEFTEIVGNFMWSEIIFGVTRSFK